MSNVLGMSRRAYPLRSVYLLAFCSMPLLGGAARKCLSNLPTGTRVAYASGMTEAIRHDTIRRISDSLLAIRRLERRPSAVQVGCSVTPAQGSLVHEVALAGTAGATTGHLARRLGVSNSAVTQLVDGLVSGDVVTRDEDAEDRRKVRVRLTTHGEGLYRHFDAARTAQTETLLSPLDNEEARILAELLDRITQGQQS